MSKLCDAVRGIVFDKAIVVFVYCFKLMFDPDIFNVVFEHGRRY